MHWFLMLVSHFFTGKSVVVVVLDRFFFHLEDNANDCWSRDGRLVQKQLYGNLLQHTQN